MGRLDIETATDADAVGRLSVAVERFADREDIPQRLLNRLLLALDELVVNAATHGGARRIVLSLALEGRRLAMELADDGAPFDPTAAPPPDLEASLEDRPIGGLGVHLVRTLMDSVSYRHVAGMNRVRMELSLTDPK